MSRAIAKRRKPRPRRRRAAAERANRATSAAVLHFAVQTFVVAFDALFGPPRVLGDSGEPEPQPATFRVVESKRLPAPQEAPR